MTWHSIIQLVILCIYKFSGLCNKRNNIRLDNIKSYCPSAPLVARYNIAPVYVR